MSEKTWKMLFVSLLLSGCSFMAGPCSERMLEGFLAVDEDGRFISVRAINIAVAEARFNGQSFERGEWQISRKNPDGCTIAYTYSLNGQPVTAPVFYIDIDSGLIYPDDEMSQSLPLVLGVTPPWGPIPDETMGP